MRTDAFDYVLPEARIAQSALPERDASRLLIVSTMEEIPFSDLADLLDEGDLVVVNRTKVRSARLACLRSDTGGQVEALLTRRIDVRRWEALLRPSRRLHSGTVLDFSDRQLTLLTEPAEGVSIVAIEPTDGVEDTIAAVGEIPLPPYFKGSLESPDRYQTMFADVVGSAAAPTAALHFTSKVVAGLANRGVSIAYIDLEVGLDTFRPMSEARVEDHVIHSEEIHVDAQTADMVNATRRNGSRVVAIGTTVVRALESTAGDMGIVEPYSGPTELFIQPGYRPKVVDALVTNFHAPRTTLLVLIAAFLGDAWSDVYAEAIEREFRFLSFGDAMFLDVRHG